MGWLKVGKQHRLFPHSLCTSDSRKINKLINNTMYNKYTYNKKKKPVAIKCIKWMRIRLFIFFFITIISHSINNNNAIVQNECELKRTRFFFFLFYFHLELMNTQIWKCLVYGSLEIKSSVRTIGFYRCCFLYFPCLFKSLSLHFAILCVEFKACVICASLLDK